jgi:hypothetical protein
LKPLFLLAEKVKFLDAAKEGNLVPLYKRVFSDQLTPVLAYRCLVQEDERDSPSFLFESIEQGKSSQHEVCCHNQQLMKRTLVFYKLMPNILDMTVATPLLLYLQDQMHGLLCWLLKLWSFPELKRLFCEAET